MMMADLEEAGWRKIQPKKVLPKKKRNQKSYKSSKKTSINVFNEFGIKNNAFPLTEKGHFKEKEKNCLKKEKWTYEL